MTVSEVAARMSWAEISLHLRAHGRTVAAADLAALMLTAYGTRADAPHLDALRARLATSAGLQ